MDDNVTKLLSIVFLIILYFPVSSVINVESLYARMLLTSNHTVRVEGLITVMTILLLFISLLISHKDNR